MDKETGGYYFSEENGSLLPGRNKNFEDNARPNSNAVSALNLLKLYNFNLYKPYRDKAKTIFTLAGEMMSRSHNAFSQMFIALDFYLDKSKEGRCGRAKTSKEKMRLLKCCIQNSYLIKPLVISRPIPSRRSQCLITKSLPKTHDCLCLRKHCLQISHRRPHQSP